MWRPQRSAPVGKANAPPAYSEEGLANTQEHAKDGAMRAFRSGIVAIGLALVAGACQPAAAGHHEGHVGSAGADPHAVPTAPVAFDQMPVLGTKAFCPVSKEA